jgi:hypothetical protein
LRLESLKPIKPPKTTAMRIFGVIKRKKPKLKMMMTSGTTNMNATKVVLGFLLILMFGLQDSYAQSDAILAKSYFLKAQQAYSAGNNTNALENLNKTLEYIGATNAKIEALYVKISISKSNYIAAENHLNTYFEIADETRSDYMEMLSLVADVKEKVKILKEKAEAERIAKENKLQEAKEKAFKEKNKRIQKDIDDFLSDPPEKISNDTWEETVGFLKKYIGEFSYEYKPSKDNSDWLEYWNKYKSRIEKDSIYTTAHHYHKSTNGESEYIQVYKMALSDLKSVYDEKNNGTKLSSISKNVQTTKKILKVSFSWKSKETKTNYHWGMTFHSEESIHPKKEAMINAFKHLAYLARKERVRNYLKENPDEDLSAVNRRQAERKKNRLVNRAKSISEQLKNEIYRVPIKGYTTRETINYLQSRLNYTITPGTSPDYKSATYFLQGNNLKITYIKNNSEKEKVNVDLTGEICTIMIGEEIGISCNSSIPVFVEYKYGYSFEDQPLKTLEIHQALRHLSNLGKIQEIENIKKQYPEEF